MSAKNCTAKDVATRAGVSAATVSRVVNGDARISKKTQVQVMAVVKELEYRVNPIARGLKTNRSMTVGLIAPELANDFFMNIAKGVEEYLHTKHYTLLVCNTSEDPKVEKDRVYHLSQQCVDGLIVIPTSANGSAYQSLHEEGIPLVLVDRTVKHFQGDVVLADNERGAFQVVSKLIEDGCTRIGFIGGSPGLTSADERHQGYRRALKAYGIPIDMDLEYFGDFHVQGGQVAIEELYRRQKKGRGFTALFIANYYMHVGVTTYLNSRAIPKMGVRIASFDDMDLSPLLNFARYTVSQPMLEMGREAAHLLVGRMTGDNPMAPGSVHRLRTEILAYGQ